MRSNVRRREEKECHVCQIRWCSLDHQWANRKTCSHECKIKLSALTQMDPLAPYSMHKRRNPFAPPPLSVVAKLTGVPFVVARAILGGQARMKKLPEAQRRALGRRAGKASAKARTPEQRSAIGRKAAAISNNKRWGTPIPEEFRNG